MKKCRLSDKQAKMFKAMYEDYPNRDLANIFGISEKSVAYYGNKWRLKKSKEVISRGRSISGIKGNHIRWNT